MRSFALVIVATGLLAGSSPQQRFDNAKARWFKHGLMSYSYRVEVTCSNCALPPPGTIRVVNGRAVRPPENLRPYDTVPKLFAMIQKALNHHGYKVQASYGPTDGEPRKVTIHLGPRVVDDTRGFVVTRFHSG
jgi:anaerobic selenocysteine-containing dehydrogenase